jgi:hypothetical protein
MSLLPLTWLPPAGDAGVMTSTDRAPAAIWRAACRAARRVADVVAECNYAQRRLYDLRIDPERYAPDNDRAPATTASSCSAASPRRGGARQERAAGALVRPVASGMHPSASHVADKLREPGRHWAGKGLPEPAPTAITAAHSRLRGRGDRQQPGLQRGRCAAARAHQRRAPGRHGQGRRSCRRRQGERADPELCAKRPVRSSAVARLATPARCARWSTSGCAPTTWWRRQAGSRTRCSPPRSPAWCASPAGPRPTWVPTTRRARPRRPRPRAPSYPRLARVHQARHGHVW